VGNKICWAPGGTVNPVVGCWGPGGTEAKPHRCPWCYAHRIAPRVAAMRAAATGKPVCQACREFRPHLHPERLDQIGKGRGRRVFIGSMCDLWSEGVDPRWRHAIVYHIGQAQQNSYIMLTKSPERMCRHDFVPADPGGTWPPNLWVGASACNIADVHDRWPEIVRSVPADRRVLSLEPCYSWPGRIIPPPAWLIIGPQTPLRAHAPIHKCDLLRAMDWARDNGTPLWLKDGCYDLWPDLPRRQELPEGMVV